MQLGLSFGVYVVAAVRGDFSPDQAACFLVTGSALSLPMKCYTRADLFDKSHTKFGKGVYGVSFWAHFDVRNVCALAAFSTHAIWGQRRPAKDYLLQDRPRLPSGMARAGIKCVCAFEFPYFDEYVGDQSANGGHEA